MEHQTDKSKETPFCPTCGRPNTIQHAPEWLLSHFGGMFGDILALLIENRRKKQGTKITDFIEVVYGDNPPEAGHQTINSTISRDKVRLHEFGWDVVGHRVTHTGWWLVPIIPQ